MNGDTEEKLDYMSEQIALRLARLGGAGVALAGGGKELIAECGTEAKDNPCRNLLYAKIATNRFYRGGRTDIDQVVEGQIPVAPGQSVLLSQKKWPGWATGCYSLRYRLANNGNNHDQIKIEWFVDSEPLDSIHWGSEIYNFDNTVIGEGKLPVPLAEGEHCCIGGNNLLRARITHTGNANQIENIRLFVDHANAVQCCSACAVGRSCQRGCANHGKGGK